MAKRKATEMARDFRKENAAYKRAIKAHCLGCMCGVKIDCQIPDCPLYPYWPYKK